MIQIRRSVFETNSSSTHSITMCMQNDYKRWVKGELWFIDRCQGEFISEAELFNYIRKNHLVNIEDLEEAEECYNNRNLERVEEIFAEYNVFTYSSWNDYCHPDLERFSDIYTTPSGDVVQAFGFYGDEY